MVRTVLVLGFALLAGTSLKAQAAAAEATRRDINLEALSRLKGMDLESNPSLKAVVLKLLDQVRGTPQFVEIVRDFKLKGQETALLEIAAKDPTGPLGAEATRLVLQGGNVTGLKDELQGTNAAIFIKVMGRTGCREIVALLEPVLLDTSRPLAERQEAVQAMASVQEGARALIELARTQKLPAELRSTARVELNRVPWENLKTQAAQYLPASGQQSTHTLPPISALIKLKGDPVKGASVFRRETVGCYKCHQINGAGTDFGPNLSEIGAKLAKSALYESILDPSAGIAFGFEAWQLSFRNGDDALGIIVSETADEVGLKTVGGSVTRYKKADIIKRHREKLSIMPTGLEQTMSTEDLVDLVEYLSSLKKAEHPDSPRTQ